MEKHPDSLEGFPLGVIPTIYSVLDISPVASSGVPWALNEVKSYNMFASTLPLLRSSGDEWTNCCHCATLDMDGLSSSLSALGYLFFFFHLSCLFLEEMKLEILGHLGYQVPLE